VSFPYEPFDLSAVETYPRPARERAPRTSEAAFLDPGSPGLVPASHPGGRHFTAIVAAMRDARCGGGIVHYAHVVKTGLAPVLIDLMERGFVSAIATNGAGVIHDVELALVGHTSEDVDEALGPGLFGMAEETGRLLNDAINEGVGDGLGLGQAVLRFLSSRQARFARSSVLASAARLEIPVTVHVGVGTDIIHMHPSASGAAIGEGSLRDFRYFVSNVARLERGVYMNCGSAVVLPEVFLKAVALARNRGIAFAGLTTVNLDFIRQYRAQTNVVARPTAGSCRGYSLVGHHEIMIPLIAAALEGGASGGGLGTRGLGD
jgi:hypothetical protein